MHEHAKNANKIEQTNVNNKKYYSRQVGLIYHINKIKKKDISIPDGEELDKN